MRISRTLIPAACVAVAITLTACSGGSGGSSDTGSDVGASVTASASAVPASASPSASPSAAVASSPSAPPVVVDLRTTLYPEMSIVDSVVQDRGDKMECNQATSRPAELKFGGTITIDGTQVVTGSGGGLVQFNANGPFFGYSLIVNGTKAANIPKAALTALTTNITLHAKDWGPINKVTVCYGGQ